MSKKYSLDVIRVTKKETGFGIQPQELDIHEIPAESTPQHGQPHNIDNFCSSFDIKSYLPYLVPAPLPDPEKSDENIAEVGKKSPESE